MEKVSRFQELLDDIKVIKRTALFVWKSRTTYLKYSIIGFVIALIVAFSIPKDYSTTVLLAPETQSSGVASGLASLTSMVGLNMGNLSEDAYTIDLYPTIVSSTDFIYGLHNIKVTSAKREINTTYADYLRKYQKRAWWEYPFVWIKGFVAKLMPTEQPSMTTDNGEISNSRVRLLSKEDYALCLNIQNKIRCSVDKITGVIAITANDQDPEISAIVADTVVNRLNRFILDYRTGKARNDYAYISAMCDTAKNVYMKAQKRYADFATKHTDIYSPAHKIEMEVLENEMSLAYSSYSAMVTQQQMSMAKILESTPVYTIIESPYIPIFADSPKKMIIVVMFVIIACVAASVKLAYVNVRQRRWRRKGA